MDTTEDILLDELTKITQPLGISVVELAVNWGKNGLNIRVIVEKASRITIGDCERITRLYNDRLTILESIEENNYTLQVTSPGIDRVFKDKAEYTIFKSRDVRIQLNRPIESGGKTTIRGKLEGLQDDNVILSTGSKPKQDIMIPLNNIRKTQLDG
jgi:ribosome maturation factor RimP